MRPVTLLCSWLLLFVTGAVSAEPIAVALTEGVIVAERAGVGAARHAGSVSGPRFSAGFNDVGYGGPAYMELCSAGPFWCPPGDLDFNPVQAGYFSIDDRTYRFDFPFGFEGAMSLLLDTPSFTLTQEHLRASGLIMRLPFTATGWARGFGGATDPEIREATLTGAGTVEAVFRQFHDGPVGPGLTLSRVTYTIGPVADDVTITAIPEPSTFLLVTAGTVLVKRRRPSASSR